MTGSAGKKSYCSFKPAASHKSTAEGNRSGTASGTKLQLCSAKSWIDLVSVRGYEVEAPSAKAGGRWSETSPSLISYLCFSFSKCRWCCDCCFCSVLDFVRREKW